MSDKPILILNITYFIITVLNLTNYERFQLRQTIQKAMREMKLLKVRTYSCSCAKKCQSMSYGVSNEI